MKTIRTKETVRDKSKNSLGLTYTRSSIARGWLFIRAQLTIRAGSFSPAQVFETPARFARQPRFAYG
jgi:hypothetical protein